MSFKFGSAAGGTSSNTNSGGGGGLYAGIALGSKKTVEEPSPLASFQSHPSENVVSTQTPLPAAQESTPAPTKDVGSMDSEKSKASSTSWSSSLRFAPVIRKPTVKSSTSKPFAVPFSNLAGTKSASNTAAAFATEEDDETAQVNLAPRSMHIPGRAKVALNATPVAAGPSKAPSVFARKGGFLAAHAPERIPGTSSIATTTPADTMKTQLDDVIPGFQYSLPAMLAQTTTLKGLVPPLPGSIPKVLKKKLDQPPPLTLPDEELGAAGGGDVNGFGQSEIGRKLALKAARTSKKNKKKGKNREVDPAILFLEDYDPARPNDYNEWMNFCKRRREQRREAIRLEREHERRKEREEFTESSFYSSEDDGSGSDVAAPANKGRFFAPPSNYNDPPQNDQDRPSVLDVPNPAISRSETGDEAYARRVALSQGIPHNPPTRIATVAEESSGSHSIPFLTDPLHSGGSGISIAEAQARAKSIADRLQNLHAENEQTAASVSSTGPAMPPPKSIPTLEEAQAKARSIAAKLAALSGGGGIPTPGPTPAAAVAQQPPCSAAESLAPESLNKAPGQPDFARRLMDKYGWKEGQGLGASESGRTTILTVSKMPAEAGKKNRHKQQPEIGPSSVPMIAIGKGRGMVVDEAKAQRDREEKERYGEPTRVVYLTNVVAVHEIDDDLSNEIAEEAGKHGIVERCFVRVVQTPVDDPAEAVRVFIIFSGLAGAWKAVKTFDGRFFGGRTIRARFFSENKLTLGDWDL